MPYIEIYRYSTSSYTCLLYTSLWLLYFLTLFGGRLGEYKYYDIDKVIASALEKSKEI